MPDQILYHHSGGYGDMIYAGPLMRSLASEGGIDLEVSAQAWTVDGKNFSMPIVEKTFEIIAPLFRLQRYIRSITYRREKSSGVRDMDGWRNRYNGNIGLSHFRLANNLGREALRVAWIDVVPNPVSRLVINRSARWHEPESEVIWSRIAQLPCKKVFIGTMAEHQDFCRQIAPVPFHPTTNLAEAAAVIAGSALFAGNQSACLAIAQGIHHPAIAYERFRERDNCDLAPEIRTAKFDEGERMEDFLMQGER